MRSVHNIDADLERLYQQDSERNANDKKRLELEERRLALQGEQFKRGAEERKATTELLRMLVSKLADKQKDKFH